MIEDPPSAVAKLRLAGGRADEFAQSKVSGDPVREEIAEYIGDMLQELRDLAKSGGLGSLAALLEIAAREAKMGLVKPPNAGQG
jgi:hypothetical protein